MHRIMVSALVSASAAAMATAAMAQSAAPAAASATAEQATLGEIVVTARRRSESLQEVPQTVNAVTSDTLQKLNIKQFQDVQNVVPGLSLVSNGTGFQASASLRGVTFDVVSTAQPTVALYMNDAPVQATFLFHSLFDIGQVEVLKGPQGTTRGVSAPSGAITVTTHKPDLSAFGGYADVTATDLQGRIAQGAINVPIIKDVLALRFAGVVDANDFDGVRSIHSNIRPRSMTTATRTSISFEPSDAFNANFVYVHMDQRLTNYQQVSGPGPGTFTNAAGTFPASLNPPISPLDRLAVQDAPNELKIHFDTVTAQLDSRIFGQHLSYVGSYQSQHLDSFAEGGGASAGDVGNVLPGVAVGQHVHTGYDGGYVTSHEIRLASDPAPGRFLDYTLGYFYRYQNNTGHVDNPGSFLPGYFGPTPQVDFHAVNPAYQIPVAIDIPGSIQETSLFGNVTLHLGENTELSGGIRHIWSIVNSSTTISLGNGLLSLPAVGLPANFPCSVLAPAFPFPVTNGANLGDCALQSASVISDLHSHASETPNIYNVSLSHHFTRDFLVYVNTGTAYRPPTASVGIQGQLANSPNPELASLNFHPSERSRAYEIGFKSTWLDGRARLNASLFRQRFSNLTIFIPGLVYNNVLPGRDPATTNVPTNFDFTASVDALVEGFDIDTAFQVTQNWNVAAQMSYSDGTIEGSRVPCNVTGANGQPVFNTNNLISLCPGGSSSRLPYWNATFQSEYVQPVNDRMDGFFRLLATYYPENRNRAEPNFTVPNYSLVNLFLGVRSHDGAWEATIFARNSFNAQRALDVSGAQTNLTSSLGGAFTGLIHPTGYYQTTQTPRREVGVNIRYAWGSR